MNRIVATAISITLLIVITGCDNTSTEKSAQADVEPISQTQPNAWILTSVPEGAVSITEAKATAKEGDHVVIRGRIGGRKSPMSADSPVLTIVDLEISYCGQFKAEGCRTPWDYCCETPETIASNSATVQIVGEGLIDPVAAGLEPLDEIILIGIVGPRPNDQVFTVRATGIYPSGG